MNSTHILGKITYKEIGQDPVTGLLVKGEFREVIHQVLQKDPDAFDLLYFDISQFKVFNHRNGIKAGDELLRIIGQVIKTSTGNSFVYRENGDHFFAIVERERSEDIAHVVHEEFIQNRRYNISIRCGIYSFTRTDINSDASILLDKARIAGNYDAGNLYQYIHRYDLRMESELILSNYILSHIDQAVEENWIKVYYQPIIDSWNHKIVYFEALSRWDDPEFGFLSPISFIRALEQGRLLYKLDMYVLEQVCRDINKHELADEMPRVSINLSRHDLQVENLHETINDILAKYKIPHSCIRIEITESALIDNEVIIQNHIRRFHQDGYSVWLDDFGSGYSSLNTLSKYDFDLIKIDMEFLREGNEKTKVIIEDIVDMAKKLGMHVLTEGVETREQLDFLASIGCSFIQGYYYTKPLDLPSMKEFMDKNKIALEDNDEHAVFKSIRSLNILDVTNSGRPNASEGITEKNSISVALYENGKFTLLYAVKELEPWFRNILGANNLQEAENVFNDPDHEFHRRAVECVSKAAHLDEVAECHLVLPGYSGILRMKCIADNGKTRAYLNLLRIGEGDKLYNPNARKEIFLASERKKPEEKKPEFSFTEFADALPTPVLIYRASEAETILYANDACIREFGCTSFEDFMEHVGRSFHTLVYPDDIDVVEEEIWKQVGDRTNPKRDYVYYRITTKDGTIKYVQDAGRFVRTKEAGDLFYVTLYPQEKIDHTLNGYQNKQ